MNEIEAVLGQVVGDEVMTTNFKIRLLKAVNEASIDINCDYST